MTRLYISGSITDGGTLTGEDVKKRLAMFHQAEKTLKDLGYEVLNPARHESDEGKTWQDYMRLSLIDIAHADAVALLPGWELSKGAVIEVDVAEKLGIPYRSLGFWVNQAKAEKAASE